MYPNPAAHGNYNDDISRYQASVSLAAAAAGYYPSGAVTGAMDPTLPTVSREQVYTSVGEKFGRVGSEVNVSMSQSSGANSQGTLIVWSVYVCESVSDVCRCGWEWRHATVHELPQHVPQQHVLSSNVLSSSSCSFCKLFRLVRT